MGPATEPPGMTAARLRVIAVTLGLAWMLLFVLTGVAFRLQFYGDGSAFSYGVALGENARIGGALFRDRQEIVAVENGNSARACDQLDPIGHAILQQYCGDGKPIGHTR